MAGYAEPLAVVLDPGVGEAAVVLVGLAFEGALFVGAADDDDGVAVAVELHVQGGLGRDHIGFVADEDEKLGFVQDGAVEGGWEEGVVDPRAHGVASMG